jgi:hypothetical protein
MVLAGLLSAFLFFTMSNAKPLDTLAPQRPPGGLHLLRLHGMLIREVARHARALAPPRLHLLRLHGMITRVGDKVQGVRRRV